MSNRAISVILDRSLSETDGLRLLGGIRELRPMPVLILSSKDSAEQTLGLCQRCAGNARP